LSPYDWGYETEAQNESCLSMKEQVSVRWENVVHGEKAARFFLEM